MNASERLLEEVETLVWSMLDDQLTDEQTARLERTLLEHEEARKTYVRCMQMHADLTFMFNDRLNQTAQPSRGKLPAAVVNALPLTLANMPTPTVG